MGSHEAYLLKWDNYLTHIVKEFYSLKSGNELVDVTLSCQGKRIGAHKMLLSACSPYFKDLFKENPCKHPIVIIQNVKFEDLEAILKFIYHGEVEIKDSHLVSFLTTAELLEVKGLVDCDRSPNNSSEENSVQSSEAMNNASETSKNKRAQNFIDAKLSASNLLLNNEFNPSSKKRKISKISNEISESESLCQQNLVAKPKINSLDFNLNSSSSEDSGPSESVGHNLINSESIEIFRVVPNDSPDDTDEVLNETISKKTGVARSKLDDQRKADVLAEFSNSIQKFSHSSFDRNSNRNNYELELLNVKEEVDLVDEMDDALSNASESPIKDLSNFEPSTSDSLNPANGFEDRFRCKICGNAYKHFNSLSSHMKKHKGQTVCPLCFKALSTRSKLRRHLILNHSVHPNDAANMIPLYSRGPSSTKIPIDNFIST